MLLFNCHCFKIDSSCHIAYIYILNTVFLSFKTKLGRPVTWSDECLVFQGYLRNSRSVTDLCGLVVVADNHFGESVL